VRLADQILEHVHLTQRQIAETRWDSKRGDRRTRTWPEAAAVSKITKVTSTCNICGWRERGFEGVEHSESALCPVCGSIARDRFLYWCWTRRTSYDPDAAVLETSPRMGGEYRMRMIERVDYTCSDYDLSMHSAMIQLDLQAIDLPDSSLDVVLTPHVLEHVPDTDKALSELFRVMKPGGHVFLQVPIPQAKTMVPTEPEYHGDMTLVYFRFGWDLADKIREHGFVCDTLVTQELRDAAAAGTCPWTHEGPDCDVEDLMAGADASTMTVIASAEEAKLHGFRPAYQFITFDCHKPA
jgi:SAM-dependent methyltransferase